jgi:hypothetical protein
MGFTPEEADLAITHVYDKCYSHEDFLQLLDEMKISRQFLVSQAG